MNERRTGAFLVFAVLTILGAYVVPPLLVAWHTPRWVGPCLSALCALGFLSFIMLDGWCRNLAARIVAPFIRVVTGIGAFVVLTRLPIPRGEEYVGHFLVAIGLGTVMVLFVAHQTGAFICGIWKRIGAEHRRA